MRKSLLFIIILSTGIFSIYGQKKARPKQPNRPKLVIEYFAEYNIFEDEIGTSHEIAETSMYNFYEACIVCPKGWHLPTQEEWAGLFPYDRMLHKGSAEPISINGVIKNYFSKYISKNGIKYAIRFMRDPDMEADNKMLSAYRYENIGSIENKDLRLKITVRYLGPSFKGNIDDIANEIYWDSNKDQDIIREFPPISLKSMPGAANGDEQGWYWTSSTPLEINAAAYRPRFVVTKPEGSIQFMLMNVGTYKPDFDKQFYMGVRCIRDKQD